VSPDTDTDTTLASEEAGHDHDREHEHDRDHEVVKAKVRAYAYRHGNGHSIKARDGDEEEEEEEEEDTVLGVRTAVRGKNGGNGAGTLATPDSSVYKLVDLESEEARAPGVGAGVGKGGYAHGYTVRFFRVRVCVCDGRLMVLIECVSYTDGDWGIDVECCCCCGDLEGEARVVRGCWWVMIWGGDGQDGSTGHSMITPRIAANFSHTLQTLQARHEIPKSLRGNAIKHFTHIALFQSEGRLLYMLFLPLSILVSFFTADFVSFVHFFFFC
jgi:hypothetical protein